MNRRSFLKTGAIGALGVAGQALGSNDTVGLQLSTPSEIEGPFYPQFEQKDTDFDLTRITGRNVEALGQHIIIQGRVVDTQGQAVEGVTVDVWQANAAGRYAHPHDTNTAAIDENFQGWAVVLSGKDGGFRFKTVLPGVYPVGDGWSRPPHIHFKVTKKGYLELITQMYFPDHPLNAVDRLLQRKDKEEQALMIAKQTSSSPNVYNYEIIIDKV